MFCTFIAFSIFCILSFSCLSRPIFFPGTTTVSKAARKDAILHKYLVIVDAIRSGRARERELAIKELKM
jgi:hypothetical protein